MVGWNFVFTSLFIPNADAYSLPQFVQEKKTICAEQSPEHFLSQDHVAGGFRMNLPESSRECFGQIHWKGSQRFPDALRCWV